MAESKSSYLGLLPSLYHTLNVEQIARLERSIWLRRVGRYQEALKIYENELAAVRHIPLIIIEHGGAYIEARKYGKLYRLVDGHLTRMAQDESALDLPEWRLLAIMKAMVIVRHKGTVEPAIIELRRMQQWLKDVPVSSYTDIQVKAGFSTSDLAVLTSSGPMCLEIYRSVHLHEAQRLTRRARV
jgi:hypothetical protein